MYTKTTNEEVGALSVMTLVQRYHYFLSRACEAEEVWSLGNHQGWELQQKGGKTVVNVWPSRQAVELYLTGRSADAQAKATSMEHFIQHLLPTMREQNILLEVMAIPKAEGKLMNAAELQFILEGIMDSGEYFLEG